MTAILAGSASAEPRVHADATGDAVPRPMDPGAVLPFDPLAHRPAELTRVTLGAWSPDDPGLDLFSGTFDDDGLFLRLVLELEGLMNPPGPADPFAFDPFRYGDHPLYGFVEIDMDNDVETGGELDASQYRYLGNAVRFGGNVLRFEFRDRVAENGSAFDENFETPPFVERHGEEFHLAFLGTEFTAANVGEVEGNGDLIFDAGETWNIEGTFFHRAHAFEQFSFVKGGRFAGEYAPRSKVQFRHDPDADATYVALVFPLTNAGAAVASGRPPQPINQDPTDQASVLEGLADLQLSAFFLPIFPTGIPEERILIGWADLDPEAYLDPAAWDITVILGSSYTEPHQDTVYFLWTDILPDVVAGDVNGSGSFDGGDRQLISQYITDFDASDGTLDSAVAVPGFASNFTLFDINHDGFVDELDMAPRWRDGDSDQDGDVDLFDFGSFQVCFENAGAPDQSCASLDLTHDRRVGLEDVSPFHSRLSGPGVVLADR